MISPTAREFITGLCDAGSFRPWSRTLTSLITGGASVGGHRVALVVGDFSLQGGTVGIAEAESFVSAVGRATRARLPVLAAPASGGTRMQEGTPAFVQMVPMTSAVLDHKRAGLPYLVYLRHPTTGGVMASWGALGHLTFAEPGALLGFLGPRVIEVLSGAPIPQGVQTAENLFAHGLVDDVLDLGALRGRLMELLGVLYGTSSDTGSARRDLPESRASHDPWSSVQASRHEDRPGVRDLLAQATEFTRLPIRGTFHEPLVLALARFADQPCVLVGQDRTSQLHGHLIGSKDLRAFRRAIRLADNLSLPLVSVIDTPGAELSRMAEEGGLASELAGCIADLLELSSPSLSILMGQGAGGAALAFLPADAVIACADAWLAPLPPEGASTIMYRDPAHTAELARSQQISAVELHRAGFVDRVLGAEVTAAEGQGWSRVLADAVAVELSTLTRPGTARRHRAARFRIDFRHRLGSGRQGRVPSA